MHRQILETCLPYLLLLAGLCVLLRFVMAVSGARWKKRSFKGLHQCEQGSVQSLSLVLTTPVFIMIVMFIVQVAHFMVGVMVVNYAAFAAARSAIVWVPAAVGNLTAEYDKPNRLPDTVSPGTNNGILLSSTSQYVTSSRKCEEIFTAAAMACAIASPSKNYGSGNNSISGQYINATQNAYAALIPSSTSNSRINPRLAAKLQYSFDNTSVRLDFMDLDSTNGPTYNPIGHPTVLYLPYEVGWEDPLIITVEHKFALMPGFGKFLAAVLTDGNGNQSNISSRVSTGNGVYQTTIKASVMLTNEGRKSIRERIHPANQDVDQLNFSTDDL